MADYNARVQGGERCPGITVEQIFARDTPPVPPLIAADSWTDQGTAAIPASRYTSRDWFEAERERMWPRVWQMAARDDEFPEAGDVAVYDNLGRSVLLVRQPDLSVKAFWNVCLHRGRKLRDAAGPACELECPFHGFVWKLDGRLDRIPGRWDFGHLNDAELTLPEVRAERMAGYWFVNWDGTVPPLAEYLAPLPEHFALWNQERNFTAVWVAKVVPANWKVVAEAFMEAWHSIVTHPQILPFTGDINSRYSLWGDHANLTLTPFGIPSPHLDAQGLSDQDVLDAFAGRSRTQQRGGRAPHPGQAGETARSMLGARNRAALDRARL